MSTEFMAGVIVAEFLEGMKFSLGPSMAISTTCLRAIGGFGSLADYLADDFILGEKVFLQGFRVVLSADVINHHAYSTGFQNSFKHRLRWNRSSRFSRPAGYFGQGFTYGLPWATHPLPLHPDGVECHFASRFSHTARMVGLCHGETASRRFVRNTSPLACAITGRFELRDLGGRIFRYGSGLARRALPNPEGWPFY